MRERTLTLWPGGLVGRVFIVLLAALGLEFAGSTLLYEQTAAILPSAERNLNRRSEAGRPDD